MTAVSLWAGVLAAAVALGATSVRAADLDYGPAPAGRYSAYEDERYRDIYGPPPVRYSEEQRYYRTVPPPPAPVPPAYVYRDRGPYGGPYPEPRRYAEDDYAAPGCMPREEIKRRLISEGWRGFHDLELRNKTALVRARRPSGDLYELRVDRCNGEIVKATLLGRGGYGPYAYDNGPRVGDRPYY